MANQAGDMIAELAVAMAAQKGVSAIANAIHPFPTEADAPRMDAKNLLKAVQTKSNR